MRKCSILIRISRLHFCGVNFPIFQHTRTVYLYCIYSIFIQNRPGFIFTTFSSLFTPPPGKISTPSVTNVFAQPADPHSTPPSVQRKNFKRAIVSIDKWSIVWYNSSIRIAPLTPPLVPCFHMNSLWTDGLNVQILLVQLVQGRAACRVTQACSPV